jgi:hypothetical protein
MKKKVKKPTITQWKRLYELAAKLKELAPWEWMEETENFGVENPKTKEIGFVSIMGMMGEHLSIGVYLGSEGLYGFLDIYSGRGAENPLALFDIPQIQLSFESREMVEKEDREIMKKLGLKFRGRQNYPIFRTIKPGFMPWFITSGEAEMLICAIEQTLEITPLVKKNPDILFNENIETLLIRFAEKKGNKLVWNEEMRKIPPPPEGEILINFPIEKLNNLKSFPQATDFILEIDIFPTPSPIAEKGKRPFFPKMLMLADQKSGAILGFELISPEETLIETEAQIPLYIIDALEKIGTSPQTIQVCSDKLFDLLEVVNKRIDVKLKQRQHLPAVETAREQMFNFLGGEMF